MINSIYIDVPELVLELDGVANDPDKALEWVRRMRDTLVFDGRKENPLPFAIECIVMSEGFIAKGAVGKMSATVKKRMSTEGQEPTEEEVREEMLNVYGESARDYLAKIDAMKRLKATIAQRKKKFFELAAGGDTREDSLDYLHAATPKGVSTGGAQLESATPAATIGDSNTGSTVPAVRPESGTIEADATHREEVDESTTVCEPYDQETDPESTNCPRQAEARQSLGAGEATPEGPSAKTSPAPPVIYFGEFGNIKMTNMQYAKLCERFNFAETVIEEADQYFEAQPAKKKKYKNHYAMLLSWCRRKAQEEEPKKRFKTNEEISRENYEISKRRLDAYFAAKEKKAV